MLLNLYTSRLQCHCVFCFVFTHLRNRDLKKTAQTINDSVVVSAATLARLIGVEIHSVQSLSNEARASAIVLLEKTLASQLQTPSTPVLTVIMYAAAVAKNASSIVGGSSKVTVGIKVQIFVRVTELLTAVSYTHTADHISMASTANSFALSDVKQYYQKCFPADRVFYYCMSHRFEEDHKTGMRDEDEEQDRQSPFPAGSAIDSFIEYWPGGSRERLRYADPENPDELVSLLSQKHGVAKNFSLGPYVRGSYDTVKRVGGPLRIDVDVRSSAYENVLPLGCSMSNSAHPKHLCDDCWYLGAAALVHIHHVAWMNFGLTRVCGFFSGSKGVHVEIRLDDDSINSPEGDSLRDAMVDGPFSFSTERIGDDFGKILLLPAKDAVLVRASCSSFRRIFEDNVVCKHGMLEFRATGADESAESSDKHPFRSVCRILGARMKTIGAPEMTRKAFWREMLFHSATAAQRLAKWHSFCALTKSIAATCKDDADRALFDMASDRVVAFYIAPRIDRGVSRIDHLMRAPLSVHPATGFIKQAIYPGAFVEFRPSRDAIHVARATADDQVARLVQKNAEMMGKCFIGKTSSIAAQIWADMNRAPVTTGANKTTG